MFNFLVNMTIAETTSTGNNYTIIKGTHQEIVDYLEALGYVPQVISIAFETDEITVLLRKK